MLFTSICLFTLVQSTSGFVTQSHALDQRKKRTQFGRDEKQGTFGLQSLHMADSDDEGWQAPKSAMIGGAGVNNAGEPPFEIRGFSLGNLVIVSGILITILSFAEYLGDSGSDGLNVSGLGFVYGVPVFL